MVFSRPFGSARLLAFSFLMANLSAALTGSDLPKAPAPKLAQATFAGGCFWSMVKPFEELPGVVQVVSGYCGGEQRQPTYEQVSFGTTGHAESVQVTYDPAKVTYARLLEVYWHNIDPMTLDRQFCDAGHQYRSAIFVRDDDQRKLAEESKRQVEAFIQERFGKPVATEIVPFKEFWPAEEYHQDFYKKNPVRYHAYRAGCGRDRRLEEIWGKKAGED